MATTDEQELVLCDRKLPTLFYLFKPTYGTLKQLSQWQPCNITHPEHGTVPSGEHLFQLLKAQKPDERIQFLSPSRHRDGRAAKAAGRNLTLTKEHLRGWDGGRAEAALYRSNILKFTQNPHLWEELKSTYPKPLGEDLYGKYGSRGYNAGHVHGNTLMRVRQHLLKKERAKQQNAPHAGAADVGTAETTSENSVSQTEVAPKAATRPAETAVVPAQAATAAHETFPKTKVRCVTVHKSPGEATAETTAPSEWEEASLSQTDQRGKNQQKSSSDKHKAEKSVTAAEDVPEGTAAKRPKTAEARATGASNKQSFAKYANEETSGGLLVCNEGQELIVHNQNGDGWCDASVAAEVGWCQKNLILTIGGRHYAKFESAGGIETNQLKVQEGQELFFHHDTEVTYEGWCRVSKAKQARGWIHATNVLNILRD
jgi:hypothetical protein